ncbi:CsbD family protein [Aeromicrobium sp.]
MGIFKKLRNTSEKTLGQAKETVGKHSSDDQLQAEGKKDQAKGSFKNAGEDIKDTFNR